MQYPPPLPPLPTSLTAKAKLWTHEACLSHHYYGLMVIELTRERPHIISSCHDLTSSQLRFCRPCSLSLRAD